MPVLPRGSGLDPPNIKISDSRGLDLEAWCLNDWMLAGLEELEEVMEVTEVTAGWEERIGRSSSFRSSADITKMLLPLCCLMTVLH